MKMKASATLRERENFPLETIEHYVQYPHVYL